MQSDRQSSRQNISGPQIPEPQRDRVGKYFSDLLTVDVDAACEFLEIIGGNAIGAGNAMRRIGLNAPLLREAYKRDVEAMIVEISRRIEAGEPKEAVARWVSAERNRIIDRVRSLSGTGTRRLYELRDRHKYGSGGRSWNNMVARYRNQGLRGEAVNEAIIAGARKSNPDVSNAAIRGAAYLRHGGRIVLVVGLTAAAARIWNASDRDLPRVIGEEVGGLVGGSIGAGAALGACMIFGIVSGGWGLLACGVVGGMAGGLLGTRAGGGVVDGIYYAAGNAITRHPGAPLVEIPVARLYSAPPEVLCSPVP